MLYPQLANLIENYLQVDPPDPRFNDALPTIITNADLRIQRDIEPLALRGQNTSISFAASTATLDLTTLTGQTIGGFPVAYAYPVVVERIAARVSGNWVEFLPVSLDFLNFVWPNPTTVAIPGGPGTPGPYFAMVSDSLATVAPTPDAIYLARVTGRWRAAPISPDLPGSWVSNNLSDLLLAAAMIEAYGWQRDFGVQAADPQAALSWSQQYEQRKAAAMHEEGMRVGYGRPRPQAPIPARAGA